MADRLRQLYRRYDWCKYFQLKIEISGNVAVGMWLVEISSHVCK